LHHTSETNPTLIRIGILTAAAAISILAIGFAPVPQVYSWLGLSALAILLTILTGPKGSNSALSLPILGLMLIPALGTLLVRGTSLIWAVVPVLAFVVAAVTWMVATNRYASIETNDETAVQASNQRSTITVTNTLDAKRNENTAATNEDTSRTAA
jgi:hypothetical protein